MFLASCDSCTRSGPEWAYRCGHTPPSRFCYFEVHCLPLPPSMLPSGTWHPLLFNECPSPGFLVHHSCARLRHHEYNLTPAYLQLPGAGPPTLSASNTSLADFLPFYIQFSLLKVALHSCTSLLRNAIFVFFYSAVVVDYTQPLSPPSFSFHLVH